MSEIIRAEEGTYISIEELTLHSLVNEHPKMTDSEYTRLKDSIYTFGQQEPVLIYRNKIVDGRHRYTAIQELGIPTIKVKEIPHNTPLDTVKEIVFSSEVRRHQSPTQKAIKAFWATQEDGIKYRDAEAKFMTNRTMISACKYISDTRGNDMLKDLFNGIPVAIGTRRTDSARTAANLIKEEEKVALDARFTEERHISIDKALEVAAPYLDALASEPTPVVEVVAKSAYRLLKQRE